MAAQPSGLSITPLTFASSANLLGVLIIQVTKEEAEQYVLQDQPLEHNTSA